MQHRCPKDDGLIVRHHLKGGDIGRGKPVLRGDGALGVVKLRHRERGTRVGSFPYAAAELKVAAATLFATKEGTSGVERQAGKRHVQHQAAESTPVSSRESASGRLTGGGMLEVLLKPVPLQRPASTSHGTSSMPHRGAPGIASPRAAGGWPTATVPGCGRHHPATRLLRPEGSSARSSRAPPSQGGDLRK